jgi:hypothetical protein
MIEQLDRAVRSGYMKKPVYYDAMMREKPTQEFYVQSDLPRARKVFREDVWRKWYYSKYPEEKETFAEEEEPRLGSFSFDNFVFCCILEGPVGTNFETVP